MGALAWQSRARQGYAGSVTMPADRVPVQHHVLAANSPQHVIANHQLARLSESEATGVPRGPAASLLARSNHVDARGGGGADAAVEDDREIASGGIGESISLGIAAATATGLAATGGAGAAAAGAAAARPTPTNVRNGPKHAAINAGDRVGMSIAITVSSSSGRDADMAGIQDSEQVGLSYNHTGSMKGVAAMPSSTSSWMAGHPIPDDQHAWSKRAIIDRADNHGGSGSIEKQQLDIWKDPAGGVTTPAAIPASGYIIKRAFTKKGTGITLRTEKRPAAVSVNGYKTTAGPSAMQFEDVAVR